MSDQQFLIIKQPHYVTKTVQNFGHKCSLFLQSVQQLSTFIENSSNYRPTIEDYYTHKRHETTFAE